MKSFMIGLIGLTTMLLGGWNVFSEQTTPPIKSQPQPAQATAIDKLAGTWYAFPGGILLQFNGDGSAQFGLDTTGAVLGYEATTNFEEQLLSIRFTNYDGQDEACRQQVGLYTVQLHQGGPISFEPVRDDCRFRLESLSGSSEADFRLLFHPLQN